MKKIIRIFLRILVTPAIIIHELSHATACLMVGVNPRHICLSFNLGSGPIQAKVFYDDTAAKRIEGSCRKFIIDIAPVIPFMIISLLVIHMLFFKYFLIYEFLVFPFSFLSASDLNSARKYLGYNKEVRIFYNKWVVQFNNWLYYEGLTEIEYFKKYGFEVITF